MSSARTFIWPALAAYAAPAFLLEILTILNTTIFYDEYKPQSGAGFIDIVSSAIFIVPAIWLGYATFTIPVAKLLIRKSYGLIVTLGLLAASGAIGGAILEVVILDLLLGRIVFPDEAPGSGEAAFLSLGASCGLYATLVWIAFNIASLKRGRTS